MRMSRAGRVFLYVSKSESCWLWTGYVDCQTGYGRFDNEGAHRVMWEMCFGPIPEDKEICHHCDVRACVNPYHLFLGSRLDNVQDMMAKGRGKTATQLHLAQFVLYVMGDMPYQQLAQEAAVSAMTAKRARRISGMPRGNRWHPILPLKRQVETRKPVGASA